MQIYHVETQEDYDALKVELEERGYSTFELNIYSFYNGDCCVDLYSGSIKHDTLEYYKKTYPLLPIQKYKAKQNGYRAEEYVSMPKEEVAKRIKDAVNSPNHYTQGEYEVIDILEDKLTSDEYMGFLKGNVTKYNFRELYKNQDEDIAKAEFYQKKMKEFVAKGKTIYSRVAKSFTNVTGYEFDSEFIEKLENGELEIVEVKNQTKASRFLDSLGEDF